MRNQIVFGADGQPNIYALGTDSPNTGVADWWLYNVRTSHFAMIADPLDLVKIGYGLMVTGATTLNGSASLLGGATIDFVDNGLHGSGFVIHTLDEMRGAGGGCGCGAH